jgi:hypothetical protein
MTLGVAVQREQQDSCNKMAYTNPRFGSIFLAVCLVLLFLPLPAAAFGAGNIPSIAQVEGKNFRHGGQFSRFCRGVNAK